MPRTRATFRIAAGDVQLEQRQTMTAVAPGVFKRATREVRPRQRRKPEPQGPFHEEAADAELRLAAFRKQIARRRRRKP